MSQKNSLTWFIVLVNNAGIGYFAAVEESEEKDIRRMFEIDFFGLALRSRFPPRPTKCSSSLVGSARCPIGYRILASDWLEAFLLRSCSLFQRSNHVYVRLCYRQSFHRRAD